MSGTGLLLDQQRVDPATLKVHHLDPPSGEIDMLPEPRQHAHLLDHQTGDRLVVPVFVQHQAAVSGPGGVEASFDWRAAFDDVEGTMLRAHLLNDVTSYT